MSRYTNALGARRAVCQKDRISTAVQLAQARRLGERPQLPSSWLTGKGSMMRQCDISPTRLRRASARRCASIKESAAGSSSRVTWAWRSTGQQAGLLRAGSARHPSIAFASRCASSTPTWTRSRASKVYLTDLALYAEFDVFPHNPPISSAVQVAGLLLEARIEMDAVAFIAKG